MGHKTIDTETEKEEEEENGDGESEDQRSVHPAFAIGKLHKHQVIIFVAAGNGTSNALGNGALSHHAQHKVKVISA